METATSGRLRVAVVVLAAGHGRRLGPAGEPGPKWLIEVGGAPVAERHLVAVEETLGPAAEVVVVVGHAADRVAKYCEDRSERSALRPLLVLNARHAERNNWYSLLVALDALEGTIGDDHVVVILNSDLFGPPEWIGAMLSAAAGLGEVPGFLAVDVVRPLTLEAMKVSAGPGDAQGRRWCRAIGKVGVPDPVGEYVGMTALAPEGRALVHEALRTFLADAGRADAWYEDAFQEVSAVRPFLVLWPTPPSPWVEIDDADDLRTAHRLAALLTGQAKEPAPAPAPPARSARRSRGS